ncbi:MAG: 50S ribosomal protein L21 [Kiritimatiellae bacterium]|nr:50S ribosomal protein L21 [Kiritimatiellia bacterium]
MSAYAVIETGGKQYLVHQEDVLQVELLDAAAGAEVELTPVLAVSDGTILKIGQPRLDNAAVNAVVVKHIRGPKVVSFKMKRRKGYHRKKGHRQELTVLKIKEITI